MATRGSPPWEPTGTDTDTLSSGIALVDELLSGKSLAPGELSVFLSGLPAGTDKTVIWRQLMEKHGSVAFDFEADLDPKFIEQLLGRAKPPDDDNTT